MKTPLNGSINTYSNIQFNLLNPTSDMVNIHDIAKGLAYKAHFGGQTPFYFSIAQHSLLTYHLMSEDYDNIKLLLLALLHDASEAYIGDMVKPLKVHLPLFCEVEDKIMKEICVKFDLNFDDLSLVKPYDIMSQDMEFDTFFNGGNFVHSVGPDNIYDEFLRIFNKLYKK